MHIHYITVFASFACSYVYLVDYWRGIGDAPLGHWLYEEHVHEPSCNNTDQVRALFDDGNHLEEAFELSSPLNHRAGISENKPPKQMYIYIYIYIFHISMYPCLKYRHPTDTMPPRHGVGWVRVFEARIYVCIDI